MLPSSRTTRPTAGWFWPLRNLRESSTATGEPCWRGLSLKSYARRHRKRKVTHKAGFEHGCLAAAFHILPWCAHRSPKWHHFRAMSKQMMLHMFQSTWENILPWQEEVEESLAVSCAAKPALQRKYAWAGSQSTCGSKQYDSFRPWGPIFSHVLRSAFQKIFDKWHQLRVEMKTNTGPSNFAECKRGS